MQRRTVLLSVALVLALLGAGLAAVVLGGDDDEGPGRAAARFLSAWEQGDLEALPELTTAAGGAAEDVVAAHRQMDDALQLTDRALEAGLVSEEAGATTVAFTAEQSVAGLGRWTYEGRLPLVDTDDGWRVEWDHSVLHPEAPPGSRFGLQRSWPERAPIVGTGGQVLVAPSEVVTVGVQPGRIADVAAVAAALQEHAGVQPGELDRLLAQPWVQPDHFVPVADLRPERFDQVRPVLAPVSGVFFRRTTGRLAPTDAFAAHTLGRVGEVTAERLEQLGPPYRAGDTVGLSGLEAALEERLAGRPQADVVVLQGDTVLATLQSFAEIAPEPVRTTLDPNVQRAVDEALTEVGAPAAMVAVDVSTGAVRAVASRPLEEPFNRALSGRYPPGSTFKVVTTAALLASGVAVDQPVECPAEVTVGGRRFRNFEGEALGTAPFRQIFAQSCNTAFAQLAADLGADPMAESARSFGFGEGAEHRLPVASVGGRFPEVADTAELAAAAIGQAQVTASPLHLATVAAAVASGGWRPATLLVDDAAPAGADARLLPSGVAPVLLDLMRAVVAEGTGTAAAAPGPPVAGKTGTAEFGEGDPLPTHALFIGVRGDLAVAVVVEGGGVGGRVAAPLAGRFFSLLPEQGGR